MGFLLYLPLPSFPPLHNAPIFHRHRMDGCLWSADFEQLVCEVVAVRQPSCPNTVPGIMVADKFSPDRCSCLSTPRAKSVSLTSTSLEVPAQQAPRSGNFRLPVVDINKRPYLPYLHVRHCSPPSAASTRARVRSTAGSVAVSRLRW